MNQPIVNRAEHRRRVDAIRQQRREEAADMSIDEDLVSRVVESFYSRVQADRILGPIFASRVEEWPPHLAKMKQFWRSVLLSSGEFSGNPMARHLEISELGAPHFVRWLQLFYATLRDECDDHAAVAHFGNRARMIADSLLTGIELRRDGLAAAKSGRNLPHA